MSWVTRTTAAEEPRRADKFIASWVAWRESCEDVRSAYRWWMECARPQRALAFATYRAALDSEQLAASIHSERAEPIRAFGP